MGTNELWFGEFPPHNYGGQEMSKSVRWVRKSIYISIGLILAGGVVLYLNTTLRLSWLEGIAGAFVTSGLLGLLIGIATRKEIVDDVVQASLGYVLPDCLRPGMRWIYNQKIICTTHTQTIEILPLQEARIVIVKTTLIRSFKNISNAPTKIAIGISIDELFANGGESDILEMGYHIGKKRVELSDKKRRTNDARMVVDKIEEELGNGEDEQIDTWSTCQEIRGLNDNLSWFFTYTTQMPQVTVKVPTNIDYDVGFQYSGDEDIKPICLGGDTWKLPMTLLPGQAISIRWWEKTKVEQYAKT